MTPIIIGLLSICLIFVQEVTIEGESPLKSDSSIVLPGEEEATTESDFELMAPPDASDDAETIVKYNIAKRAYYEYRIDSYDHRHRVYEWQLLSSRIIFVAVILLLLVGIYFAAVQFHAGVRDSTSSPDNEREPKVKVNDSDEDSDEAVVEKGVKDPRVATQMMTEIEASTSGIKVSSPVLGVIILIISMAFFYLYLLYVYPIVDSF